MLATTRRRPTLALGLALALTAVLASCTSDGEPDDGVELDQLSGGAWELVEGRTSTGPLTPPDGSRITFVVEDDATFGGTAACNSYGGQLAIDGDSVDLTDMSSTLMGCEPPLMEAESQFLAALEAVDAASRDGDQLTLTGPDVELRFRLRPPAKDQALVGTTWVLGSLLSGEGPDGVASSVEGEPELEFHEDGTFVMHTGCRGFTGRWQTSGDEIITPELAATDAEGCDGALQSQEDHVLAVFEGGMRVTLQAGQLTLTADDGTALSYHPR